jgi:hypothetical protein
MKYFAFKGKPQYEFAEEAFTPPLRLMSPLHRQWYLWKFYHEPSYHPNKQRCNTILHGMSTPRG